jgi:hypothetical protein
MNDYASAAEFVMMHESIAAMLGVRRVGVTEAASRLQAAGLIAYARGRIRVLDKAGLRKKSCACYRSSGSNTRGCTRACLGCCPGHEEGPRLLDSGFRCRVSRATPRANLGREFT